MTIPTTRQTRRKRPMRSRRIVLLTILLGLGGGYGVWRSHGDGVASAAATAKSSQPPPKVPVTVAIARKADFPLYLFGLGTVTPLNTVSVSSRVVGVVTQVPVE